MHRSEQRILTTHVGSLPRPRPLTDLLLRQERGEAIDPEGEAGVGRSAVTERVEEEPELALGLLGSDAEKLEHPALHVAAVAAQAARAQLHAVEHYVVVGPANPFRSAFQQREILLQRRHEGLVDVSEAALLVPLEEREVDHEEHVPGATIAAPQTLAQVEAQSGQDGVGPLGLIGASMALLVFQAPFGFVAILGVIALGGMIMRNSVILVDQIDQDMQAGQPMHEAIVNSAVRRFRPIVLTAITAALALVPLSMSPFWGPMALAMMGGLLAGTVLTLTFLPALYALAFGAGTPAAQGLAPGQGVRPEPQPAPALTLSQTGG